MQKNNYVYLIQPREFIRLNEQTYKIGKTTQEINKRMYGYPKSSKVILFTFLKKRYAKNLNHFNFWHTFFLKR